MRQAKPTYYNLGYGLLTETDDGTFTFQYDENYVEIINKGIGIKELLQQAIIIQIFSVYQNKANLGYKKWIALILD